MLNLKINTMKKASLALLILISLNSACQKAKQLDPSNVSENQNKTHLYMDVHNLEPGKVKFSDVAKAHRQDVATQGKYGTNFIKFWVDENAGKVYCLVESPDSASIYNTHKEANGLIPDFVQMVNDGDEAAAKSIGALFLDVHVLGPGKVTAADVAKAHAKDLAVQDKHHVNLINYWLDEKRGVVMCLAEAPDSLALIRTHVEANGAGLIPNAVHKVKEGN
jgi:hypothetical protein